MGTIRLGALQVDPSRNVIANDITSWSIEPRIMDLLVLLAAHPGEVLSRDTLIEQVWKVEFGADESLTRAVSLLRKTFREAGGKGELIETIPKRGYRLVVTPEAAPATPIGAPPVSNARQEAAEPAETTRTPSNRGNSLVVTPDPASRDPAGAQDNAGRRLSLRVVGIAAAAVLAVAALAVFVLRPQASRPESTPSSQLIAFFEFTPTGDDPAVRATAEAATDRMFQSMGGWKNFLGTVARTETRGTPENMRFARAAELGARYALGGEVRPDTNGMTLSIRFEDISSRLTLMERSFSAPASDVAYLPAQAALQAAQHLWCIVKTRSELKRDTDEILNLIADRCRGGATTNERNASYAASRMRAITEADPGSAYNLAQLVAVISGDVDTMPPSARATRIAEAEAVLKRAAEVDPKEPNLLWGRIALEGAKGIPVAEFDATVLDAAAKAEGKDAYVFGNANYNRSLILQATGQFREALPHIVIAVANDTLRPPWASGPYYAVLGRKAQARAEIEPALAAYGAWVWEPMIPYAIFFDAADAEAMLTSPPSTIPKPTVDCLRDIRKALASTTSGARATGAARARTCEEAGTIRTMAALTALTALNDLDAAFTLADRQTFNASSLSNNALQVLFWPMSRDMRADPRFLPLVEKLGLMDYWRATKSQPDVCETETAPFCAALRAANARP